MEKFKSMDEFSVFNLWNMGLLDWLGWLDSLAWLEWLDSLGWLDGFSTCF